MPDLFHLVVSLLISSTNDLWNFQGVRMSHSCYRTLEDAYAKQRTQQVILGNRCGNESLCRKHETEVTGVSIIYCCITNYSKLSDLAKQPLLYIARFVCQELKQGSAGQFICSIWQQLGHCVIFRWWLHSHACALEGTAGSSDLLSCAHLLLRTVLCHILSPAG